MSTGSAPRNFSKAKRGTLTVCLISRLWDIRVPLAALLEKVDDTIFAASADTMSE